MRKILLVDDDPVLLELGAESLMAAGFEVVCAGNGENAVPILQKEAFDLLVLDIEMPKLNGLSLLKWIRASSDSAIASLPVIMLTGRNDDKAVQTCYDFGATSYIAKPVSWLNMTHQIAFVLRSSDDAEALRKAHEFEQKLSQAKDGLMMTLRHELRSPLHVIQGFTTLLADTAGAKLSSDEKQSLNLIDKTVDDMAAKLSRLFLYAETLTGEFALTPDYTTTSRIVDRAIGSALDLSTERMVSVEFEKSESKAVECKVDEEKIVIALSEVIDNAVRLTPRGGTVTVRLLDDTQDDLSFVVDDEGPGIDPETVEDLFEPFVQSDGGLTRTSIGVGLGLSVAKSIIERHRGTLKITNRNEQGASALLKLPVEFSVSEKVAA